MRLLWIAWLLAQSPPAAERKGPEQPVPYSHKTHAGTLQLACKSCHTNPDPGETMGLPPAGTCMGCHQSVKTDSPHIQKLAAFARDGKPVPWVRIYRIASWVFFSHRAHQEAGASCETCHGPVKEREQLRLEGNISMGGCMDCHDKHQASNDCGYCHQPR